MKKVVRKRPRRNPRLFFCDAISNGAGRLRQPACGVTWPYFPNWGALAPRNRSTNQNAQIMKKERRKIPPHARNVGAKPVAMTSSQKC